MHDSDPYLGAIVHYRRERDRCLAAMITEVTQPLRKISLRVFAPNGDENVRDAPHDSWSPGSWHWRHECD